MKTVFNDSGESATVTVYRSVLDRPETNLIDPIDNVSND
jgi:hypothetical protein